MLMNYFKVLQISTALSFRMFQNPIRILLDSWMATCNRFMVSVNIITLKRKDIISGCQRELRNSELQPRDTTLRPVEN